MSRVNKVLQDGLTGPILDEISDPREHQTIDILRSYFREIIVIAKKYARPTVEFDDLVIEGLMGLMDAIERWDPERATGPKTFRQLAIVRIKSHMFEYFLRNRTPYSIPTYMSRAMTLVDQLKSLISSYECDMNKDEVLFKYDTPEALAKVPQGLSAKITSVKERIQNIGAGTGKSYEDVVRNVLRIEEEIHAYEESEEFEVSPEDITSQKEFLNKFLNNLNEDARDVIALLLEGRTLTEVGDEKGFTRERARQIKNETLDFFQRTRMFKDANK